MATQCQKISFGSALYPEENIVEKPKRIPDHRSIPKKKRIRLKKPKDEGAEGGDKAAGQFPLPFQDQENCQEINGKEAERKKIVENLDNEDSWSSDDGEGISVEELKETNGYKLFKEALQAHTKNSAKSV